MDEHTHTTENTDPVLQTLVDYYRNKSNKIEHEFLLYQIRSESIIRTLQGQIGELSSLLSESEKEPKSTK